MRAKGIDLSVAKNDVCDFPAERINPVCVFRPLGIRMIAQQYQRLALLEITYQHAPGKTGLADSAA